MSEEKQGFMSIHRRFHPLWTVTATIILGAVGSGLWEIFLRDLYFSLGGVVLTALASVWGGYLDLLHAKIGSGESDILVLPIFTIMVTALLLAPWFLLFETLSSIRRAESEGEGKNINLDPVSFRAYLQSTKRRIYRVSIPVSLIGTLLVAIQVWHVSYTRSAVNWASQSIEILAPDITNQQLLRFRSDFRMVKTAKQFYKLEDDLKKEAERSKIELPKFESIGRP